MNRNVPETKEYVLDNGLKVLCLQTHGLPLTTFMVWYKVGSRNETEGKTGLSHFLEHLSFKSTDLFDSGQIAAEITRNGGNFNAYTSRDFTCYYETFATNKLELAMIIESQRMNNLILHKYDVEKELGVILSEMEKNLDNPYSALDTGLRAKAYTKHSYKNPIIGWKEDVKSINEEDLSSYYKKYYVPNNATIVVVGNFKTKEVLELVKKHFASIPPGEFFDDIPKEHRQKGLRRTVVRKQGSCPIIKLAYHIPSASHPDTYPLTVLGEMLNMGISSRLHQSIVETNIATDFNLNVETAKDPGLFSLNSTLFPKIKHAQAEEIILNEIKQLHDGKPATAEELENTKRRIKSSFEFNRDGTFKYAYLLGYYETVCSYKYIDTYVENIQKVSIDDIKRVAEKYLVPTNCTIGEFVPSEHETKKLVVDYDFQPKEKTHHFYHAPSIIIEDKIISSPINFSKKILKNGLTILHTENKTSDTLKLYGNIKAGNIYSASVSSALPVICAGMLNRGSIGKTKIEIASEVESRGASVGINNIGESVSFSLSSTVEDFPLILQNLALILRYPAFLIDEFDKYKQFIIAGINQKKTSTSYLAEQAFNKNLFPKGHLLYADTIQNQEKQVNEIILDDVSRFYQEYYSPHTTIMSVSGNISEEKVYRLIEKAFGDWNRIKVPEPVFKKARLRKKYSEKTVKVKDKKEASVIFGHYAPITRMSKDYERAVVMNFIFGGGGALSSRIGLKIREDLGLVYSISSGFSRFSVPGIWSVKFGVDCNFVGMAVDALKEELHKFLEKGVTDAELDLAKSYITGSYPLRFNNNAGVASSLLVNEYYKLGDNYLNEYPLIIEAITREEVNEAARNYLHPQCATLVQAGDF